MQHKFQKRLFVLAIIAIPAFLAEIWAAYYYYEFYQTGHAPMSLIVKSIILPTCFWSLIFIFTIIAWKKRWYWYVFVPLITTYPWIYNNFIIILSNKLNMTGQLYWTVMLYGWTKIIFYLAALISSIYFIINKFQQNYTTRIQVISATFRKKLS